MKKRGLSIQAKRLFGLVCLTAVVCFIFRGNAMGALMQEETTTQETSMRYAGSPEPSLLEEKTQILYSPSSKEIQPLQMQESVRTKTMVTTNQPLAIERRVVSTEVQKEEHPSSLADIVGGIAAFPFHLTGGVIQAIL